MCPSPLKGKRASISQPRPLWKPSIVSPWFPRASPPQFGGKRPPPVEKRFVLLWAPQNLRPSQIWGSLLGNSKGPPWQIPPGENVLPANAKLVPIGPGANPPLVPTLNPGFFSLNALVPMGSSLPGNQAFQPRAPTRWCLMVKPKFDLEFCR